MKLAFKLLVVAVLTAVVVILVAPTVDLPDSIEIRSGVVKLIVATVATLVAALPAVLPAFLPAVLHWDDRAASPRELAVPLTDLCGS